MAGIDRRSAVAAVLERVRRATSEIESTTSVMPLPAPPPAATDSEALYDAMVTNTELRAVTRKLFLDGHFAQAVEQACKLVNNSVKSKTKSAKDGPDLMQHAFGTATPPLRINPGKTQSHRDEQEGYRFMFAGLHAITGYRDYTAVRHVRLVARRFNRVGDASASLQRHG